MGENLPQAVAPVLLGAANTETATTSISNATGTALSATTSSDGDSALTGADASIKGGYGVYGRSGNGDGVYGLTEGNGRYGVYGTSPGGSGVYGTSPDGTGVTGTSTEGWGVSGATYGDNGFGVVGAAYAESTGVYAFGDGDNSLGVYAEAIGSRAISVFAAGDVTVTGSLSKGGGSFRIDHPLDPANKYLYHSFVESPDMMNVYNGTIVLDQDGRAVVGLADWFEALNRDYRYQLTPIGGPAPDLHIAAKVSDGQFAIAGGTAGQEVSWQITGIRQDAWANAHRIPVEETKPAEDQGRYLHPELHGGEPITIVARVRAHAEAHRQSQHRQAAP